MEDNIQRVIVSTLAAAGRPPLDLVPALETPLADGGLELSSLDLVRALVQVEEQLDVQLDGVALAIAELRTVGDVAGLVARTVASGA